jgi:hypothetical protein
MAFPGLAHPHGWTGAAAEALPRNETVIRRGLEGRRDLHAAVSVYSGRGIIAEPELPASSISGTDPAKETIL